MNTTYGIAEILIYLAVNTLYLRAAEMHLQLATFFESPTSKGHESHVIRLWQCTTTFLECSYSLDIATGFHIRHASNYVLQMIIAAAFTLLKLFHSRFTTDADSNYGKTLFKNAVYMIRLISVSTNDLPSRLAEVLAQLWKSAGADAMSAKRDAEEPDSLLQLKVRSRLSMSIVYDSVWRWR